MNAAHTARLAGTALALSSPALALSTPAFTDATGTHTPVMLTSKNTMDAEAFDLDGDGDLDLVLAIEFGPNIVLYNDGTGRFPEADAITLGTQPTDAEDIAIADVNGDGRPDLIFACEDTPAHELFIHQEDGTFVDASKKIPVSTVANAVVAHDLTGDGHIDLILGNKGQDTFLVGDGMGGFTDATAERLPKDTGITQDLELGDIDGDGDIDILVANENDNALLINDGTGVFAFAPEGSFPLPDHPEETREADLADLDGDGDLDICCANVAWVPGAVPRNRVLLNDGTGRFTDATADALPAAAFFTLDVDLVDLDGDGDLDWISAELNAGAPTLLFNDGTGVFTPAPVGIIPPITYGSAVDIECADLNGDGHLDLYLTHFGQPDMLLLGTD